MNDTAFWTCCLFGIVVYLIIRATRPKRREVLNRTDLYAAAAAAAVGGSANTSVPKPKRGEEIFANADSPRTWDAYIGQPKAKQMLNLAIKSAIFRKARMGHVLIASGAPGIGKSALARLIGAELGVGVVEIQDTLDVTEARAIIGGMRDGDILVWDEFHQALNKGKKVAEWLLPFLQDGTLPTPDEGLKKMPDVTVIAATTDAEKVPETILSRFPIRPVLENYSPDEYREIARLSSGSFFDKIGLAPLTDATLSEVAAASGSPRLMKNLMGNLRDCEIGGLATRDGSGNLDIGPTLDLMGLTRDGMTTEMTDFLVQLFVMSNGGAFPVGGPTLWGALGLPTDVRPFATESALTSRGLILTSREGRSLTPVGKDRTLDLLRERGLLPAA